MPDREHEEWLRDRAEMAKKQPAYSAKSLAPQDDEDELRKATQKAAEKKALDEELSEEDDEDDDESEEQA